jgi:hypothetical protein
MDKPIKLSRVEKVYSGKSHECYCGCSGKYYYPDDAPNRYPEEVSSAKVKRIVNKLNKYASDVIYIKGTPEDIYTLTIGRHDWTVYLKPYSNLDYLEEKYEEKIALDKITII